MPTFEIAYVYLKLKEVSLSLSFITPNCFVGFSSLTNLFQSKKSVFGHVWTIISGVTHQSYQLVLSINDLVKSVWTFFSLNKEAAVPLNPSDIALHSISDDSHHPLNHIKIENGKLLIPDEGGDESVQLSWELTQSARDLIDEIKKDTTECSWREYLNILSKLDQETEVLKIHVSKFEEHSLGYDLVQDSMKAIASHRTFIDKKMCGQIRLHYQPNSNIPPDGHCLFWSIEDQLKKGKDPTYYRQLAADYIRKNPEEFPGILSDTNESKESKKKIASYQKTQGGLQACFDKLKKKIGRMPTQVDLYCDYLENSNLWAGRSEVLALSEQLKIQILIFSRQNQESLRFDAGEGLTKFKENECILLYYNGSNHYQNLIPVRS